MSQALRETSQRLRDTSNVSEQEAQRIINGLFNNSPFLQKAPVQFSGDHSLARRQNVQIRLPTSTVSELQRKMELTLWATWCQGLRREVQRPMPTGDTGPGGMPILDPSQTFTAVEYTRPGYAVEQRLHELGVHIDGQRAGDFFGGRFNPTTASEIRALIRWADNFINDQANHIEVVPE